MEQTEGEIFETRDIPSGTRIECKIARIDSYLKRDGGTIESLPYTFCNAKWTLQLTRRRDLVDVDLNRGVKMAIHNDTVEFELNIKRSDMEANFLSKGAIDKANWNHIVIPAEYLFQYNVRSDIDAKIICLLQCFDCKFKASAVPLRCTFFPSCLKKVLPLPWTGVNRDDTIISNKQNASFDSLRRDLLELLISGEDSDVTINVKGRVFRVHKSIIRARSPVFFSMLQHDMVERRNGTVDIPDCEPEAFQIFLEYIYIGELRDFSKDMVCNLYYISDKYQVSELKTECLEFMSKILSLENFCEIAALSVRHNELKLLECAKKFFAENWKAIVETDGWLAFLQENPAAASVLNIPGYHGAERELESVAGEGGILTKLRMMCGLK